MRPYGVLECVVNVSEGRRLDVVEAIAGAGGRHVLDVHTDADHNRSVLTLAGPDVEAATFAVVDAAVSLVDLRAHDGVHPRLGAADVVPFVPLPATAATLDDARRARDACAVRIADELGVPCFVYGPERDLPSVRRDAFTSLLPFAGDAEPHPTAGACCVGARDVLVAFNVWLARGAAFDDARRVAAAIRGPSLRTLAFVVGGGQRVQVSCNLVDPLAFGPADAFDAVAASLPAERGELVGLVPHAVLDAVAPGRWEQLDLSPDRTIEARLRQAGLDGGSPA